MSGWWLPLLSALAQSASRLQLWQAQQLSDALTLIRGGPEAKSQLFAGRKEALLHLKHFAAHLEPQVGEPFLRLPLDRLAWMDSPTRLPLHTALQEARQRPD